MSSAKKLTKDAHLPLASMFGQHVPILCESLYAQSSRSICAQGAQHFKNCRSWGACDVRFGIQQSKHGMPDCPKLPMP